MKFPKTILLVLLFAALAASSELSAAPADNLKSFVIRADTGLWTLKGSDMTWAESLSLGQELQVSKAIEKGNYKKVEYVLAKVKLDTGKDGYVIDSYVARNALMGVVTSELGSLYKEARDAAVTDIILPVASVVALWPVAGKSDFYKVMAYDETRKIVHKDRFVSASDVSVKEKDVNVALLLKAMSGMSKWEQKRKILSTIDSKYQGSAFASLVESARQGLDSGSSGGSPADSASSSSQAAPFATEKNTQYWVATAPLNIRAQPNTQAAVVTVLNKGDFCSTSENSTEYVTLDGKSGRWYKTAQPAVGWVFGAFLEPAEEN